MGVTLPITSKLMPLNLRNVAYLAEAAVLTRVMTGIVRVIENQPQKNKDVNTTSNQKRQAMIERSFVEIVGTLGYMAFLHLGQDMVSKIYENRIKPRIPQVANIQCEKKKAEVLKALTQLGCDVQKFDHMVKTLYAPYKGSGSESKDLIKRVLYGQVMPEIVREEKDKTVIHPRLMINNCYKANLTTLKIELFKQPEIISHLNNTLYPESQNLQVVKDMAQIEKLFDKNYRKLIGKFDSLQNFAKNNNRWASCGILFGVGLSALVGGTVLQWVNDRLVAPTAKNILVKKFGEPPSPGLTKGNVANPLLPVEPNKRRGWMSAATSNIATAPPLSISPSEIFPSNSGHAGNAPVYLPNPKVQAPGAAFSAHALNRSYANPLLFRGGL